MKNIHRTFLFLEPTVTCGKLLPMMEASALHCIPEDFSSYKMYHLTSSIIFLPFWTWSFKEVLLPGHHSLQTSLLYNFAF
jgi:hypothetical protein